MTETKCISPLLDGFSLGTPMGEHDGVRCCPAIKEHTDKKYIVKIIAIPATQVQMDAMIMAGAFKDPEGAMAYYKELSDDVMQEAQFLKDLSRLEGFLSYEAWQMEPITKYRLGYEVYLLGSYKRSLEKYVRKNPMTHLQAINLGLDLCAALRICRESGALYVDLKPSNIFVSDQKEYRIGDLGFVKLDALSYTALPSKYRSCYTPPELHDPMASLNLTADIYAAGMILYQIYNEGRLPFKDKAPEESLPTPVNADYELAEIIMKAIHPDPAQRWQDPKEMGQALVSYMQRNAVNDVPITPYTPIDTEAQNVRISQEEESSEETIILAETETDATSVDKGSVSEQEPTAEGTAQANIVEPQSDTAETDSEVSEQNYEEDQDFPSEEADSEEDTLSSELPAESDEPIAEDEMTRFMQKVEELSAHETPAGVVVPEIPEEEDPFAFATEDSIEFQDLTIPIDPVMDLDPEETENKGKAKKKFLSPQRKKAVKRFCAALLALLVLAFIGCCGFWYYQNIYLQTIDSIQVEGEMDRLMVSIQTEADSSLLTVTCSDNYGNVKTQDARNGQAEFTGLIPNTMYRIDLEIDGFHALKGQTSQVFTTDTTTNILSFTAVTGTEDGSVILNFSVDGEEPREWKLAYAAEGEETQHKTFLGHSVTIDGLSLGKVYTFTLDAGESLSLSGSTSVEFMPSRLILAENLTITTTSGSDMTIHWNAPGDTVVEFWNVRCYNDSGYEELQTVTDTQVYLSGIDSSLGYTVEVTAAGMTQPACASITANPLNITALNVDESKYSELIVSWEFTGESPDGWLLMYTIDGNSDLNVIKCDTPNAIITPRIPGATYQFTIQSAEGTSIFGNVHSYSCPDGEPYDENSITATDIKVSLLKTPEDDSWSFEKVGSDEFTDQFAFGDPISIVLYAEPNFYLPGTELDILYVIRDTHGNVIPEYLTQSHDYWKQIWNGGSYHYGELDLPAAPTKAGSYVLRIYFNGAFIAEAPFTVTE